MNCPNCQTVNPEGAKFCMNCGTPLGTGEKGGESTSRFLNQYVPQELVAKLEAARKRGGMAGERRVITMLFCDVKSSTAAAEGVDPETWTEIMNGAFERMIRPIYTYEGTVARLMGDAILAFFGAPIAHEDDPQRAVLAGLEIQSAIKPYAEEMRRKHGLEFGLRVGVNTGLVVVGEIGSDLRMEYTAIGDAINLAARMEQTASPGTVQITEDTYKLIAPLFDFESLGGIEVKGKAAPVKAFRVLGPKKAPGHLRGLEGLTSPLVGREAELSLLKECLARLGKGAGGLVAVVGEAGLGKSSLIAEAQKSQEAKRFNWLRGEALSYSRSTSYFPWRQVIRQAIEAHEGDSPDEVRGKLHYVCECCALPGGDVPFLEAILAVESEESLKTVMGYQGEALVERMNDAVRGYLCGLAAEGPLTLVFDDLHWADEASLNLLLNLADLPLSHPLLFICMLRPDKQAASWDFLQKAGERAGAGFHSVQLNPLQPEQTQVLLGNLLGVKDLPQPLWDLVAEKAGGNPFFIEELIRSLIETKQIVRENSHWRAANEDAKVILPDTLRGLLGARIDRLPEAARQALQTASVIGRFFDRGVLERLVGGEALDAQIQNLAEAGLIEPAGDEARGEYAFRHVLIQEAAYDSVLLKSRAELHRRIGETLEELHADRVEEFAPLLAHHFYAAGDERSLKYDQLAGEKAARLYANAEAATHFRRALETAKRVKAETGQVAQLFSQLGGALELSGRHDGALKNYDEMLAFGRERGDKSVELNALMAKATIYSIFSQLHNSALSEQMLVQALEISAELGDRLVQARLNWNLMLNYLFSKRLDQALQHGELALTLARESGDREQLAFVLNDLCRLYTCKGQFEQAYAAVHEARELWRLLNIEPMYIDSLGAEAEARYNAGEYAASLELSRQALDLSQKTENLWGQAYNRMLMGFVLSEQGEIGQAIQLWGEAVLLGDKGSLLASTIGTRSDLAWIYGYYGGIPKGLELIEQALAAAEAKQPEWKALPLAIQVRLSLLNGDLRSAEGAAGPASLEPVSIPYARYTIVVRLANVELAMAQGHFERALGLVEDLLKEVESITRPDVPEVVRTKGDILLALGRMEEAQQALAQARSLAEAHGSRHNLWMILASLATVDAQLGKAEEAAQNREAARGIVEAIADSLRETGLRESFMSQPRVRALTHS